MTGTGRRAQVTFHLVARAGVTGLAACLFDWVSAHSMPANPV